MEIRFAFGQNWLNFARSLTPEQVTSAEGCLRDLCGSLHGKSFLDAGCGSGLMSLAAQRLGASVRAFDYDGKSVECSRGLGIRAQRGSALDADFLATLGSFDVVYSWGVLHHTGAMWQAIRNVGRLTKENGLFVVALYNDQGLRSRYWKIEKYLYSACAWLRPVMAIAHAPWLAARLFYRLATGRWSDNKRGMSYWYDYLDWLGGYPFEVASREEVIAKVEADGFRHVRTLSVGNRGGCNEFVFRRA